MANTKTFSSYNYVGKDGRYITLTVTETPNAATNTSDVSWVLSTNGGAVTYYDTFCLVKINGTQVYFSNGMFSAAGYSGWIGSANHPIDTEAWVDSNWNENTCAKWGFTTSGTVSGIAHNTNGTKSITVTFLVGIFYYKVVDCGGSFSLSTIDRTPPVITQQQPGNITYNSCTIAASSDVTCSKWWYNKKKAADDNWDGWVVINESIDHLSKTVTGLDPNTEYQFQWCGRKASNGVDGYSDIKSIITLGASILNSVSDIYVDTSPVMLSYDITTYSDTFYHKLILVNGNNNITINLGRKNDFENPKSLESFKSTLLSWIGNTNFTSPNITVILRTYTDSTYNVQVGNDSVCSNTIKAIIREDKAKPTLTVGGYIDVHTWGSNDSNKPPSTIYIVPGVSELQINGIRTSLQFNATVSSLTIKDVNRNEIRDVNSGNYKWGTVSDNSNVFVITLTDSRGLSTSVRLLIKIYKRGSLITVKDYNYWRNILISHYSAKKYDGTYFISGTSSSGFNLPQLHTGDIVEAENINSSTNGIYKHINAFPISSNGYYYSERSIINNIKSITKPSSIGDGSLIKAITKSDLDTYFKALDNIKLFNLVKGE